MRIIVTYAALILFTAAAAVSTVPGEKNATLTAINVVSLTSPAGQNSAQPQLSRQTSGERVTVSWLQREGKRATLMFAERTSGGWSDARAVAAGDDFFVNWADVPSVVRLTDDTMAAHWLQQSGPETYAYDVKLAFSKDEGRTWSASTTPHHDGRPVEHGFATLFPDANGMGLVWLDGRSMKPADHEEMSGDMTLRAATFDRSGTQTSEALVDDRVCECCPTAAAIAADGPIIAFRNRSADEIRDIYVSRLVSGRWTKPAPVHDDGWKIAACPVNGPALSARGRDVVVAWFTGVNQRGQVFAAFSHDAGKTFGAPIAIHDSGAVGRVDVELLANGAAVVSWIEFADQRSQFRIRQVQPSGARSPSVSVAAISASRASGYPRMAATGDELVFAWTDASDTLPQVRTAVAKLENLRARPLNDTR